DVLTQTLVRSTNLWGYRMYPRNVISLSVKAFLPHVDVWRCFDFLNYVPNMIPVAEEVMKGGKIFEPAISFSVSDDCTNAYYLKVTREILKVAGGPKEMILCIKDMAGVGSPKRISELVDALLQKHPDLVIHFHRHATDGLAVPALVAAAKAGVKILDVTDDPFSRYYGHAPVRSVHALLSENGIKTSLDLELVDQAAETVTSFIGNYNDFESQYKGFSYKVTEHRMPGGAFPSSFEQAEKGGFIKLMPAILRGMSYGNRFIKYFDVTPGSQITWTTWAAIIQYHFKEGGWRQVESVLSVCRKFIEKKQILEKLISDEAELLIDLYSRATDDLKNLLLGKYGPLPFGWPDDWVYHSVFGEEWVDIVKKERIEKTPLTLKEEEEISEIRKELEGKLGRHASHQELVLYLQHPGATVDFLEFRSKFGPTHVLPSKVWFDGLEKAGSEVRFEVDGRPNAIKLVSVGREVDGTKHIVLSVNNTMHVFPVEMPKKRAMGLAGTRFADPSKPGEVASSIMGNVWRIGDKDRSLEVGDIVREGEEIMNIEAMKIENAILAPVDGVIQEIPIRLNQPVVEKQLLMVIEEGTVSRRRKQSSQAKNTKEKK
ncbi:MAG TPA: biotin/lipoyl-containing protein, partial [Nitrospiria bacterium]|nr:biotin/lipoyl-containing protein [Nitrospiria bacterium]